MTRELLPPPTRMPMHKRIFIKTYGCQMNVYDGERMAELMAPLGYESAATPNGADLVILNTDSGPNAIAELPDILAGYKGGRRVFERNLR